MMLSESQIQQVEEGTGASVVSQSNPAMPALKEHFGEHTFFLDQQGLHVWEPVQDDRSAGGKLVGVRLATWSDEEKTALKAHEPVPTHVLADGGVGPLDR